MSSVRLPIEIYETKRESCNRLMHIAYLRQCLTAVELNFQEGQDQLVIQVQVKPDFHLNGEDWQKVAHVLHACLVDTLRDHFESWLDYEEETEQGILSRFEERDTKGGS